MLLIEHSLVPGQIRAASLRRGTLIVAVDGPLAITYRNPSLDWLSPAAPMIAIALDEGDAHIVPFDAFVEIRTPAHVRANARIECPVHHANVLRTLLQSVVRTLSRSQKTRPRAGPTR